MTLEEANEKMKKYHEGAMTNGEIIERIFGANSDLIENAATNTAHCILELHPEYAQFGVAFVIDVIYTAFLGGAAVARVVPFGRNEESLH